MQIVTFVPSSAPVVLFSFIALDSRQDLVFSRRREICRRVSSSPSSSPSSFLSSSRSSTTSSFSFSYEAEFRRRSFFSPIATPASPRSTNQLLRRPAEGRRPLTSDGRRRRQRWRRRWRRLVVGQREGRLDEDGVEDLLESGLVQHRPAFIVCQPLTRHGHLSGVEDDARRRADEHSPVFGGKSDEREQTTGITVGYIEALSFGRENPFFLSLGGLNAVFRLSSRLSSKYRFEISQNYYHLYNNNNNNHHYYLVI